MAQKGKEHDREGIESLTVRQLECFVALAETLHFAEAARRLGMAQPPLSRSIRRLEKNLSARLFQRDSGRTTLTRVGEAILIPAQRVVSQLHMVAEVARRTAAGEQGRLTVGFSSSAALTLLPSLLQAYRRSSPGVNVVLRELSTAAQLAELEAGRLDIAVVRGPVTDDTLHATVLHSERFVAVLPKGHPLQSRRAVTLASLARESFVLFPSSEAPAFHREIIAACGRAGFTPNVAEEAGEWHTIVGLVGVGLGVTIAPESVGRLKWPTVAVRPLTGCSARAELIVVRLSSNVSPATDTFLRVAATWKTRHVRGQSRAAVSRAGNQ